MAISRSGHIWRVINSIVLARIRRSLGWIRDALSALDDLYPRGAVTSKFPTFSSPVHPHLELHVVESLHHGSAILAQDFLLSHCLSDH